MISMLLFKGRTEFRTIIVCSGQAEKGIARIKHRWDVQPAEVTEENSEVQHTR